MPQRDTSASPDAPAAAFATAFADIEQRAAHALALQQAGRPFDAAAHYRAVLAVRPRHSLSLLNLGVILIQMHRFAEAADMFGRAIEAGPGAALAHAKRAEIFSALGRDAEALTEVDAAIAIAADNYFLWFQKASILRVSRRFAEADACLEKALVLTEGAGRAGPPNGEAVAAAAEGAASGEVVAAFASAAPDAAADGARAALLANGQRHADALTIYERMLSAAPEERSVRYARCVTLVSLNRTEEALTGLAALLEEKPDDHDALGIRCLLLVMLRRFAEALADADRGLQLAGGTSAAWLARRGLALGGLDRLEEALSCFDRAILQEPFNSAHFMNRGHIQMFRNRIAESIADATRAIALDPNGKGARFNRACSRLLVGDFENGWLDYEARWYVMDNVLPQERVPLPIWDGKSALAGRSVLIVGEQGMGDTLQFLRYAPILAARGARVAVWVQPPLARLALRIEGVSGVVDKLVVGTTLPFDLQCPLLSLPLLLGTRAETIPPVPAIALDDAEVASWRARLGPQRRPRVGLVWAGNPKHSNDRQRSMALETLLAGMPEDVELVSLQKDLRAEDPAVLAARGVMDVSQDLADMLDTAALIRALDIVVSVDTSVAHLAASLAVPTFIVLAFAPDWRWRLERTDSDWYRSVRLFRQSVPGDWTEALAAVRAAISAFAGRWRPDAD